MSTVTIKDADGLDVEVQAPNSNGRAAAAGSRPMVLATEDFAAVGSLTESAPGTDTASSGLNGRLQRLAQRITSLMALVGEVQASPTANTVLDRLKTLAGYVDGLETLIGTSNTTLSAIDGHVDGLESLITSTNAALGEVQASPTANTVLDRLKTLSTLIGEVQASPTANTLLDRLKTIGSTVYTEDAAGASDPVGPTLLMRRTDTLSSMVSSDGDWVGAVSDSFGRQHVKPPRIGYTSSVTITRPADTTAYGPNDVIGGVQQFTSIGPSGGEIAIVGIELTVEANALETGEGAYFLALFSASPTSALADNSAWNYPGTDRTQLLAKISLGTPEDCGSTLYLRNNGLYVPMKLSGTSLYAYLATANTWSTNTASVVRTVVLHADARP